MIVEQRASLCRGKNELASVYFLCFSLLYGEMESGGKVRRSCMVNFFVLEIESERERKRLKDGGKRGSFCMEFFQDLLVCLDFNFCMAFI